MATDMISVLMGRMDTLAAQQARLTATVNVIEQRTRTEATSTKREIFIRLKEISKEVKGLEKKLNTQPIALRQLMDTWWLRLVAIACLGMANIDLKHAVALVLQLK